MFDGSVSGAAGALGHWQLLAGGDAKAEGQEGRKPAGLRPPVIMECMLALKSWLYSCPAGCSCNPLMAAALAETCHGGNTSEAVTHCASRHKDAA